MTSICSWCKHPIGPCAGRHLGEPAHNYGMCPDCLGARLAKLTDSLDSRARARARRMFRSGRNAVYIGGVLGVSVPSVEEALRAA
jgi:hypothetical protein